MANPFDDLIPGGAPKGGAFDDLVPPSGRSKLSRGVGLGAQGFTDAVADFLGMPVDLAAGGMRVIGRGMADAVNRTTTGQSYADPATVPVPTTPIGGSQTFRDVFDYVGTAPGRVVDAIDQGSFGPMTEPRTGRLTPQDGVEKFAYGAGKGVGGAFTSVVPASLIAQAAPAGSVTQAVARTMAQRPAMQAFGGAVAGGTTEVTGNPYIGMGAGIAATGGADLMRRAVTPRMMLTPDEQRIAAAAQARGIELTPAQATGSRGLQVLESTLRRLPIAGNIAERGFDQQRQALNREITAAAGNMAQRAGPGVMDDLYQRAGATFDDLLTRQGHVDITPQTATAVARVVQDHGRRLPTDVARTFQSYVDDLTPLLQAAHSGQNPRVDAGWYQNVRSDLTRRLRGLDHGDPLHGALMGLRDALDDSAMATRPDLAPAWQQARQQYANLSTLDKAMRSAPAADAAAGNVPLGAFRNAVRGADPEGFARGRGDMNELAQIAGFLQNKVPNSGTPERGVMTAALLGGGAFEPITALTAAGIPAVAQALYNTRPVRQMLSTPGPSLARDTAPVVEALLLQQLRQQLGGALVPR